MMARHIPLAFWKDFFNSFDWENLFEETTIFDDNAQSGSLAAACVSLNIHYSASGKSKQFFNYLKLC